MLRLKKGALKIRCFYCQEKRLEYADGQLNFINRAYCDECEEEHFRNRAQKGREYREYQEYLGKIRAQFRRRLFQRRKNEIIETDLCLKDGKLFKGDIELGRKVGEDDFFIYVKKDPLGSICTYQRKFIKEL